MKVAIIGSGISGLVASYLLRKKHEVTLFEKNSYIGGHTATKVLGPEHGSISVDTGFIVFNDRTYPNFEKFIRKLGVSAEKTEMSYSVANPSAKLEYNGHGLSSLFAQKSNLINPKFYKLLFDISRFNRLATKAHSEQSISASETLGSFLDQHGFNDYFRVNYLMSMGAAIWSSSIREMEHFPALLFVRFFMNHGLLSVTDRPQWYVIKGGSNQYVEAWKKACQEDVLVESGVVEVKRTHNTVEVKTEGKTLQYDRVIFACHSDEALELLGDGASESEADVLGDIPFQNNEVVLHTDISRLPTRRSAWAAWNYMLDCSENPQATLTYNMNILQGLKSDKTYCVSLNQTEKIDEEHIVGVYQYSHPVFNSRSFGAQSKRSHINGHNRTYFCGAYWYNGFHEDGVRSALDVVQALDGEEL